MHTFMPKAKLNRYNKSVFSVLENQFKTERKWIKPRKGISEYFKNFFGNSEFRVTMFTYDLGFFRR